MAYKYYKDNRSFIDACAKTGDAIVVNEEVDWDLEMGAIVRRTCEKKGPAVFFKNIKDYPGFECVGAPLSPTEGWQSHSVWIRTAKYPTFLPNT